MSSRGDDVRRVTRAVEAAGGTWERTRKGHLKVYGPDGVAHVSSKAEGSTLDKVVGSIRKYAGLIIEVK